MYKIVVSKFRPIPLRRLMDIWANPNIITKEEARIIRDNDIAGREIIRLGLSPSNIISRFDLDEEDNQDSLFFE